MQVRGASPGQRITLRYVERLQPDGNLYTANLRTARATDTYICRGRSQLGGPEQGDGVHAGGEEEEEEVWEPAFTFHGFQYVELTGYPGGQGIHPLNCPAALLNTH